MTGYPFAVVLTLVVVAFVLLLLRTRRLREKYAAVWIVLALAVCVLAAFPDLAFWLADVAGVRTPVNLLFSAAIVVLLGVCIQLSSEVSALEEETRTVAEELALLAHTVEGMQDGARPAAARDRAALPASPQPGATSPPPVPPPTARRPVEAPDDRPRRTG